MKPERVYGTFNRTHQKLLDTTGKQRNMVVFTNGHIYSGVRSLYLSPSGRRINKLLRLLKYVIPLRS